MKILLATAALLVALPAAAHPETSAASAFTAGLLHPVTGLDHLLALLGVGMWSRQQASPALALVFLAAMAGAALAFGDAHVPAASEWLMAAGVALVGVLLAVGGKASMRVALPLVLLLGALHGQTHAAELPASASAAGFLMASAALLMAGRWMAAFAPRARGGEGGPAEGRTRAGPGTRSPNWPA